MNETINIHEIQVKPGEKKCGYIKIGDLSSGPLEIPIVIINGKEEGPILCITAGMHACEYAGIAAVIKILKEIKAEHLSGAILGVPIQNLYCFDNRRPYLTGPTPFGSEYLATRNIKPDPRGSLASRLRHLLINDIVLKSNMHIDCHGGDFDERLNPNTYYNEINNKEYDKISNILSRIYGFRYLIRQSVPDTGLSQKKVPNIIAECGGMKTLLKSDIIQHMEGIKNVMKYFIMIEGEPRIRVNQYLVKEFCSIIRPEKGGLFYPNIDIGDKVLKNMIIGEIWNIWGDVIEYLKSPCEGVVRKIFTNHATHTGEPLIQIMKSPKPAPPFPLTDKYINLDDYNQTSKIYI